jgi:hypothetical protein
MVGRGGLGPATADALSIPRAAAREAAIVLAVMTVFGFMDCLSFCFSAKLWLSLHGTTFTVFQMRH